MVYPEDIQNLNANSRAAIRELWGNVRINAGFEKMFSEQIHTIAAHEVLGDGGKAMLALRISDTPGGRTIFVAQDGSGGFEEFMRDDDGLRRPALSPEYAGKILNLVRQLKQDPAFVYRPLEPASPSRTSGVLAPTPETLTLS